MSLISKVLSATMRSGLSRQVKQDILSARGNLQDDFPSDFSAEEKEDIKAVRPYTMTSPERLVCLSRAIDYIVEHRIEGDIVECGVWKGGSMLLVARKLARLKSDSRNLFLFDTFEGMSEPGKEDVSVDHQSAKDLLAASDQIAGNNVWCYSPLDEVRETLRKSNYPFGRIHFIKGKVEDTLPEPSVGRIAILRLDTDWYESTRHELNSLYDLLMPGGILIIDDYGHWSGSRKAVDEFILARRLDLFLQRIDYTGRMAVKK